ncbi:MAG: rhodanese-related sulfurtransferase, partial [Thermoflavifilum sp.]|nr:rhodanese-related sulfurtransferase [Thermoflavifilum sp.]
QILGRVYIAPEGINAQISVPEEHIEDFSAFVREHPLLGSEVLLNWAVEQNGISFQKLKIKLRKKIVADGIDDPAFMFSQKGIYVDARAFNELTDAPDTLVVDMRNHYEYEVGHFENAWQVPADTFREQLPLAVEMLRGQEHRPIVMYCTGGIRCEKASAWLLHNGFRQVYHLRGGIIEYTRQVRQLGLKNKFHGKNFVFDGRMGERISDEIIGRCYQCGRPSDRQVNCRNDACHMLFIQCEDCASRYEGCCSEACQQVIHLPEAQQRLVRKLAARLQPAFCNARVRRQRPTMQDLLQMLQQGVELSLAQPALIYPTTGDR